MFSFTCTISLPIWWFLNKYLNTIPYSGTIKCINIQWITMCTDRPRLDGGTQKITWATVLIAQTHGLGKMLSGKIWSRQTITETTEDVRRLRLSRTAQSGVGLRRYTCRLNVWFPTNSEHKTKLNNYSMKRLWLNTSAALFTVWIKSFIALFSGQPRF